MAEDNRVRVVGRRREYGPDGTIGVPEPVKAFARSMARFGGGWPKGVYRYRSHEDANADQERWDAERMARQGL